MNEQEYILFLQQNIRTTLQEMNISFRESADDFVFGLNGEQDRYMVLIKPDNNGIRFYCSKLDNISLTQCNRIAEYITRINTRLRYGGFELNYSTGDLRYKTTISFYREDCNNDLHISRTIRMMLLLSIEMMERYVPGVNQLLQNNTLTPEQVIH